MEEEGSVGCQKNSCKIKAGIETSMDKLSWITLNKSTAKARDLQTLNEPLNKPCRDWRRRINWMPEKFMQEKAAVETYMDKLSGITQQKNTPKKNKRLQKLKLVSLELQTMEGENESRDSLEVQRKQELLS
jgi:hypothetical protein